MTQTTSSTLASRIGAGIAVVVVAVTFFSLGIWQLDRAAALKASLVTATTVNPTVVPLESIATANSTLNPQAINRMVSVSGRYVADFRAPGQTDGAGATNDWEVGLLQVGSNEGILVVRGLWSERQLNSGVQASTLVSVNGQLCAHQDSDHANNSTGIISRLDSAVIVGSTNLDLFDGYILATSEKEGGIDLARVRLNPEKLVSRIPGFYWQHLSYVVIWWLMAGVVLYLPFYRRKVDL